MKKNRKSFDHAGDRADSTGYMNENKNGRNHKAAEKNIA